jgi:tetratricopeptide (TPR) repeat protein
MAGMAKTVKMIPKKLKKATRKDAPVTTIEKKPLSLKERKKKRRMDLLRIARRYEEMKLYDDAINYYKKLRRLDDVERIMNTKNELYVEKAKGFEAQEKFEDALRLYENLKMTADVARLKRMLGKDDMVESQPSPETPQSAPPPVTAEPVSPRNATDSDAFSATVEQETDTQQTIISPEQLPELEPVEEPKTVTNKKIFRICPYCGEELNLPKKPNFCPYCTEAFV